MPDFTFMSPSANLLQNKEAMSMRTGILNLSVSHLGLQGYKRFLPDFFCLNYSFCVLITVSLPYPSSLKAHSGLREPNPYEKHHGSPFAFCSPTFPLFDHTGSSLLCGLSRCGEWGLLSSCRAELLIVVLSLVVEQGF